MDEVKLEAEKETAQIPKTEEEVQETKKHKRNSIIRELIIDLFIVAVCVMVIPRYVVQRTIVSGSSMEETLLDGDNLLVDKFSYLIGSPDRFDVVVFYPYGQKDGEYFVKRVIGLPGETIQIIGDTIYINGEVLEENFGKDPITVQGIAEEPLTLGEDEYFLMGDNREVSYDSRYEEVGPVHENLIVGRALVRIWPLNSFGSFEQN